jgi:type I restriction enzyme M protein
LIGKIKNSSLYGVDAGSDPAIHRIARMNMYLHGDGGSHIFHADFIDKGIGAVGADSIENNKQLNELRKLIVDDGIRFDVILSNPPFSLKYSPTDEEHVTVLNQYELSYLASDGKKSGLLSSVMFLERYKDLVSEDGQVLAVIDDSVLSGSSYSSVRDYIRDNFIVVAIISLPGDAFRRASARVKTSVLILRLRKSGESQPEVFMASAVTLGLEEKIARRIGIPAAGLEARKKDETTDIVNRYRRFRMGEAIDGIVGPEKIFDRLDVKHCIGDSGRRAPLWEHQGYNVIEVENALNPASNRDVKVVDDEAFQLLRVNYSGEVVEGELLTGEECSYSKLFKVKEWDILLSNMGVGRGAVAIVPPHHAEKFVSNEYTILTASGEEEAVFYVTALRSKEILGDILATTTGMNRGRIKWENIASVKVPQYKAGNQHIVSVAQDLKALWSAHAAFMKSRDDHVAAVTLELQMDGDEARLRWLSFKPPE